MRTDNKIKKNGNTHGNIFKVNALLLNTGINQKAGFENIRLVYFNRPTDKL